MGYAKKLYNEATSITNMKKITAVNFNRLERWRGRVSQGIADAKNKLQPGQKSSSEVAYLSGMLQRFDDAFDKLPVEAIKNGDDAIIEQLARARAARTEQGVLFEKSKIVADVLRNNEITNESLAHALFTSGGNNAKQRAVNLDKVMKAAGDKSPEVLEAAKSGFYSNILRKSMDAQEITATGEGMVSFGKLATQLDDLVNKQPTLFKKLHPTKEEQDLVKAGLEAARRIKSHKPGTKNYSNSSYAILNFVNSISPTVSRAKVPLTDFSAENVLKNMAQSDANFDLQKALAPVLKDAADQLDGPTYKFLERFAPAAAVASGANASRITVRPDPTTENYPDTQ